jgi:PHD/YefM family antitoxin component YafN of YafNO toxin-antitoxin module
MADQTTMTTSEPDLYARFESKTSKQARQQLPSLIDQVVDSGQPVLIKKLKVGRAALIPARELWIHEIVTRLEMDRTSVNLPIDDLMREVFKRLKIYLEERSESGIDEK